MSDHDGPFALRVHDKWRPGLALVVYSVLLVVMAMPVGIVLWFRTVEKVAPGELLPAEILALGMAFVLTLVVAYVLTRTITAPIDALNRRANEIGRGGRSAIRPLDAYGTNEIANLSQSFLDLAGRLVDQADYVRSFAAHVSHELKSPLTSIRGAAELMRESADEVPMTAEERGHFLDNIIADAKRLDLLLSRLRELSAAEKPAEQGVIDLVTIAERLNAKGQGLDIVLAGGETNRMALSPETADIIFGNLADNARQHGATRLSLHAETDGQMLALRIVDNGRGIAPADRDAIFQPFFTTRRETGGTGLGFDIVRAMLATQGGAIRLDEQPQAGAAFVITVPHAAGSKV